MVEDDKYSIQTQLKWSYNQKAFKLLAAMQSEYGVKKYIDFAEKYQPFVRDTKGFFKGNLYPFPCHNIDSWSEDSIEVTGASDKSEYIQWCREYRLPVIKQWVEEYCPQVVIGVGIGNRNEFSLAVFGEIVDLSEKIITINGSRKRIFYYVNGYKKLVIIPHFSGPNGLNSNESLQKAGEFIADIVEQKSKNIFSK